MKRLVLTDALIREALSPDPHVTAPPACWRRSRPTSRARRSTGRSGSRPCRGRGAWRGSSSVRRRCWRCSGRCSSPAAHGTRSRPSCPPAPSPLLQRLPVEMAMGTEIEAVSADEAWASDGTERICAHRTAAGWTGPIRVSATLTSPTARTQPSSPRTVISATWPGCPTAALSSAPTVAVGGRRIRMDERGDTWPGASSVDTAGVIWAAIVGTGYRISCLSRGRRYLAISSVPSARPVAVGRCGRRRLGLDRRHRLRRSDGGCPPDRWLLGRVRPVGRWGDPRCPGIATSADGRVAARSWTSWNRRPVYRRADS